MRVQYVGAKPSKADNIAGTGLTWGPGQAHDVPIEAWEKLAKHPDVWALVDDATTIAAAADGTGLTWSNGRRATEGKFMVAVKAADGEITPMCLDQVGEAELLKLARAAGLKGGVLNKRGDSMRQAIVDAVTAAG